MPIAEFTKNIADEGETSLLAQRIAAQLRPRDVLLLSGKLGMGKTFFARSLIRALMGSDITVPSPSFSLVQTYDLPNQIILWHFDLYRIKRSEEIWELGLEEALSDGISLIEWPERMGNYRPPDAMTLTITAPRDPNPSARVFSLKNRGAS